MPDSFFRTLGGLFLLIALLSFLEMIELVSGAGRYFWPGAVVLVGAVGLVSKHREVLSISGLLLLGGIGEIARVSVLTPILTGLIWPIVLLVIGWQLARRIGKGKLEMRLAGSLLLLGLVRIIGVVSGIHKGTVELGWILLAAWSGALIIFYGSFARERIKL